MLELRARANGCSTVAIRKFRDQGSDFWFRALEDMLGGSGIQFEALPKRTPNPKTKPKPFPAE